MAKQSDNGLRAFLRAAAKRAPARGVSLYARVKAAYPEILALRKARFTDKEIHALFLEKGVKISLGTLRQYIQQIASELREEAAPGDNARSGASADPRQTPASRKPGSGQPSASPRSVQGHPARQLSPLASAGTGVTGHLLSDSDV
jgi:hypothetical protein